MKDVHDLRARTRHVEAIAAVFLPDEDKPKRHLLKTLKPVLKVAGEVRDMDVLGVKVRTLARRREDHSVTRLLEHLQAMRLESAAELVETVARKQKDACRSLKQFSKLIEGRLHAKHARAATGTNAHEPGVGAANKLMDELCRWPAFNAENLHAFRIKVKELRNVLRLTRDANPEFVNTLEQVKTRIGDWHDWHQLKEIAKKVLAGKANRAALREIEEIASTRFNRALASAYGLRSRYLSGYSGPTIAEP